MADVTLIPIGENEVRLIPVDEGNSSVRLFGNDRSRSGGMQSVLGIASPSDRAARAVADDIANVITTAPATVVSGAVRGAGSLQVAVAQAKAPGFMPGMGYVDSTGKAIPVDDTGEVFTPPDRSYYTKRDKGMERSGFDKMDQADATMAQIKQDAPVNSPLIDKYLREGFNQAGNMLPTLPLAAIPVFGPELSVQMMAQGAGADAIKKGREIGLTDEEIDDYKAKTIIPEYAGERLSIGPMMAVLNNKVPFLKALGTHQLAEITSEMGTSHFQLAADKAYEKPGLSKEERNRIYDSWINMDAQRKDPGAMTEWVENMKDTAITTLGMTHVMGAAGGVHRVAAKIGEAATAPARGMESLTAEEANAAEPVQAQQTPVSRPVTLSPYQNEAYNDTTDMPAPKGPLETAANQTIPPTTTGPEAAPDNIPAFIPPTTPVTPESVPPVDVFGGMAPPSQPVAVTPPPSMPGYAIPERKEVTEADQVDFENAVLWENNLRKQGRSAVPDIKGEPTRDHAWRLLETYRKMITPTVAADSAANTVQSDSEQGKTKKGNINGATDTVPGMQGASKVDGVAMEVPAVQGGDTGRTNNIPEPRGLTDEVSQVRQKTGTAQEVPPVRGEDVVAPIDEAAHAAATSPHNDTPEPSQAQLKAGNYKKGHVNLHGLDISIENPAGSLRKGVDENGKAWETKLAHHYGYIKGTIGNDKDHIDTFVGPYHDSQNVYVVDQKNTKTGAFDEHKVMMGFNNPGSARAGYLANYDKSGPLRINDITSTSVDEFKNWLKEGDTTKPFAAIKERFDEESPATVRKSASWVIKNRATGEVILETFDQKKVAALNTDKYEAIPIYEYLVSLNKKNQTTVSPEQAERAATFAQTRLRALERKLKKAQGPVMIKKAQKALNDHKATMKASEPEPVKVKTVRATKPVEGLNPSRDHLLTAIAKLGGLDLANAVSLWGSMAGDAAADKKINHKLFGRPLFRKTGGLNVDTMAELLAEHGYLQRDENHKHDLVDFEERLTSAIAGKTVVSDQNHQEVALEMPEFSDEDLNELSLDDSFHEIFSADIADLFEQLAAEDYDVVAEHWNEAEKIKDQLVKEYNDGQQNGTNNAEEVGNASTGEAPQISTRDGNADKQSTGTDKTPETGKRAGTASAVESQDKLFATPPTFGTKPQPKTTNSDVSTSDLLDNFTSVESVQPDLLKVMPKEQTFDPVVMPSLDDFDKLVTELTAKPESPAAPAPAKKETSAKSAKTHAANAYDAGLSAIKAILDNASNPDKLNNGIGIDDEVYQQIKPHLTKMWFEAKAAGSDAMQALREFIQRVINDLGEKIVPYSRTFYQEVLNGGIIEATNKGEETDVNVERSSADLERDSQDPGTADRVGQETLSDGPDGTDGSIHSGSGLADGERFAGGRDTLLPRREAATPGEFGNPPVQSNLQQMGSERGAAGAKLNQRSGDFDDRRASSEPVSTEAIDKAAARTRGIKQRISAQKNAGNIKIVPGDLSNIESTLPLLLTGQTDDVKFAEDRFVKPAGYGAMFTNGTGTGKTFVGLGLIKRLERQSKTNTLIVTPQANVLHSWIKSGKHFNLDITPLKNTQDAGTGIVVTTFANFGQNNALATRNWDAVVFDEAQYLNSNQTGDATNAQSVMRAITLHPDGAWQRADMLNGELKAKIAEASAAFNEAYKKKAPQAELDRLKAPLDVLNRKMDEARKQVRAEVTAAQGTDKRSRVLFLSATPFAYDKNIEYANGYLFDYGPPVDSGGYNSGGAKERFFMQHFGYRMRYDKLTEPEAEVDQGLMQRQFNSWLKQQKVLSGRMLAVDQDYDRKFVLIESAIGRTIDEGLQFLHDNHAEYGPLYSYISKKFDYLHRRYLLEAIKAKEIIPIIKQHLALNRKIVVFHDYNQGGGMNPFDVRGITGSHELVTVGTYPNQKSVELGSIAAKFVAARPDLVKLPFASYGSALSTLQGAFPDALLVNGTVSKKDNLKAEELFQDHKSGRNLIVVQADKGKEGISLHDTVGDMQRVMFNLGLPVKPTQAIQQEGRIFRTGQASNAMFRYLNTGTNWERWAFATTIARRASTAENLAMGEDARMLLDAFVEAYQDSDAYAPGHEGEGTGGIARDRAANAALTEWDRALTYYFSQQKKTSRNKAQEGIDYFPTPEPIALKMVEWADILPGESVLEPSAGHGAIARFLPASAKRRAIEPSTELSSRLGLIFDGDIVQGRFEDHHVVNKYDAIVMNPPFGTASKTAFEHIEKAAQHLKDKGRIVALVPAGPASDKRLEKLLYEEKVVPIEPLGNLRGVNVFAGDTVKYYPAAAEMRRMGLTGPVTATITKDGELGRSYYVKLPNGQQFAVPTELLHDPQPTGKRDKRSVSDLTLVADIQLPRVTFERAGTSVAGHIIVLDKNRTDDGSSTRHRDYTAAETINDLFERVRDAELPERQRNSQPYDAAPVTPAAVDTETGTITADLTQSSELLELSEFPHTQTGAAMYVAAMKDRLPAEQYAALNKLAKQNGGSYSKYKGGAAVPGFLFKSRETRQAFVNAVAGETPAASATLHSNPMFDPAQIVASLSGLAKNLKEDMPKLVNLGQAAIRDGASKYQQFLDGMKRYLGDKWDAFKGLMLKVYHQAKAAYKDSPLGNEIGAIGDIQPTYSKATSQIGDSYISVRDNRLRVAGFDVETYTMAHAADPHLLTVISQISKDGKSVMLVSRIIAGKTVYLDNVKSLLSDPERSGVLRPLYLAEADIAQRYGLTIRADISNDEVTGKLFKEFYPQFTIDVNNPMKHEARHESTGQTTVIGSGTAAKLHGPRYFSQQEGLNYFQTNQADQRGSSRVADEGQSVRVTGNDTTAKYSIPRTTIMQGDSGLGDVSVTPAKSLPFIKRALDQENAEQVLVKGGNVDALKRVAAGFGKTIVFFKMRSVAGVDTGGSEKAGLRIHDGRDGSGVDTGTNGESAGVSGENAATSRPDGRVDAGLQQDEGTIEGFVNPAQPNIIFLNVDAANHILFTLGHEVSHTIKMHDYNLWLDMVKELTPLVRRWSDFKNKMSERYSSLSELEKSEELFADVMGHHFLNDLFWQEIAQENPGIFTKIARKAIQLINKVLRLMAVDVRPYISDLEQSRAIIAKTLLQYGENVNREQYGKFAEQQDLEYLNSRLQGQSILEHLRSVGISDEKLRAALGIEQETVEPAKFSIKHNLENVSEKSLLDNLKGILNPLDYSRFRTTASEHLPHHATTWLADNVGNPFWMKENNPEAVPFYDEAKDREVTRMDNNIRMFGGLFDKEGTRVGWDKVKGLLDWSDKTTGWGKVRQEMYNNLTGKQKAAYDVIRFEGDAYNKTYAKLSDALRNVRIKAAGMDAQTFAFYQAALAEEAKAFDVKLAIAQENMAESGMTPEDIEGHIAEYRAKYKDIEGWVHRDHGEGEYQVRVYQTVDSLDFESDVVQHKGEPTDRIRLGTFPGVELSRSMEKIVERRGGSFKQLRNGAIIILMPEGHGQETLDEFHNLPLVDKDGEPKYKVLVYNHFVSSVAEAKKLTAKVKSDYRAAMPRNYRDGYTYDTSWNFSAKVNEEDYQVLKTSDMKLELILRNAIDKAKTKSEISAVDAAGVQDALVQSVAEILLGRGAGLYQIRRAQYLIEGYDTNNAVKKYEDYINGTAGLFSKARYALRQFNNMKSASPQIRAWATKYVGDSLRNMGTADKISGNMRAIVSLWYLGFNTSWMLVNSTQPYVVGQAELSRYTTSPAFKIAKAEKDILTGKLSAEEKALLEDIQVRSQDHDSVMAEMTGSLEGVTGKASQVLHNVTQVAMALGQKVEVLNRHTMIVAGYRVFKEQGMSNDAALKNALDVNSMVNIDMGRFNLPGWARGPVGRTFYALQSYIQHMLNYLWNRSSSGNRNDQKAVLRLLFAMFLIGGLPTGAPGSDELDKLIQKMFGYSPKLALKAWSNKMGKDYGTIGEMLEGFVWHGIPGAFKPFGVGVSLTGATQLRIPVISNVIAGDDMAKSLGGPVWGLAQKGKMSIQAALRGDWGRTAEYLLPTAIANPLSGIRQATDGVRTTSGKRVEYKGKQLKMEPREAAIRAFGLQPVRTADISETRGFEKSAQAEWNDRRKDALDNYRMSRKLKFIQEFNKDLRGSQAQGLVSPISTESLANVWGKTNKKKNSWEREHGAD